MLAEAFFVDPRVEGDRRRGAASPADRYDGHAMEQPTTVIDVRIELPAGDSHEYVCDPDVPSVRLRRTLRAQGTYPADWAVVPATLTPDGRPLGVIVINDLPCSPGSLARVRLLGLLTVGSDRQLVAVLADDPRRAGLLSWEQLGGEERAEIEALSQTHEAHAADGPSWAGPAEAALAVQEARRAARLAKAEYHATRGRPPAWRASGIDAAADSAGHTEGEVLLYRIPYRFQQYVARLLVPEERILAFAPRPRGTGDGRRLFGRRQRAEEGVLVITDQQVLWLVDLPGSPLDVEAYGYVAHSVPVERLVGVSATPRPGAVLLEIESQAARGGRWSLAVAFPTASAGLVAEIVATARLFLNPSPRGALLRLASPPEDETDWWQLVETDDRVSRHAVERWREFVPTLLTAGEHLVAKAVIPGWFATDGQPVAWLASTDRLLAVPADPETRMPRYWRAGSMGAVRLIYSVFESSVAFEWLREDAIVRERVVFPLLSAAQFVRLFVALRRIQVGRASFVPEDAGKSASAGQGKAGESASAGEGRAAKTPGTRGDRRAESASTGQDKAVASARRGAGKAGAGRAEAR